MQSWKVPNEQIAGELLGKAVVRTSTTDILKSCNHSLIEEAEVGMYGRATQLMVELVHLYGAYFPASELKILSPLRTIDGKTSVEYAVVVNLWKVCHRYRGHTM